MIQLYLFGLYFGIGELAWRQYFFIHLSPLCMFDRSWYTVFTIAIATHPVAFLPCPMMFAP